MQVGKLVLSTCVSTTLVSMQLRLYRFMSPLSQCSVTPNVAALLVASTSTFCRRWVRKVAKRFCEGRVAGVT